MATSDADAIVHDAFDEAEKGEVELAAPTRGSNLESRRDASRARRTRALSLRLAGYTLEQIGEALGVSTERAKQLIDHTLNRAENQNVEQMRELENARLDRLQAALWNDAIKGDLKAVDRVLRISQQRAKLNGLDAPQKVDLSLGIKNDMEQSLRQLEALVLEGEVIDERAENSG